MVSAATATQVGEGRQAASRTKQDEDRCRCVQNVAEAGVGACVQNGTGCCRCLRNGVIDGLAFACTSAHNHKGITLPKDESIQTLHLQLELLLLLPWVERSNYLR